MISSLEKSRIQYTADADSMATKSRFGFFSIPPSHTAGITDYAQKKGNLSHYTSQ
jgi:hypothetical protein